MLQYLQMTDWGQISYFPSLLWCCWLGVSGVQPVKTSGTCNSQSFFFPIPSGDWSQLAWS